jgi:hypothetical protein
LNARGILTIVWQKSYCLSHAINRLFILEEAYFFKLWQ